MKRIEVGNCMECPWWRNAHACGMANKKLDIMEMDKAIPQWCPLRGAGEIVISLKRKMNKDGKS